MSKTVFLTGGSSGIGHAISKQLSLGGWQVIAPTHSELNLANLDEVTGFHFSDRDIDTFIHVAGVWHDETTIFADKSFDVFSSKQIIDTMNVGVYAPMILINKLLKEGQLRNVLAISGTFESGAKGWLPYYTSKRALEDFLVGLAQDNRKLIVYGISPADTDTVAYRHFYPEYAKLAQSTETIAGLVESLLDETEEYASGSVIEIRDGRHRLGFHA